ncbi:AraC family transcriptional regulator [Paenibacillus sp. HB172176]|uniref:helix-turn-helix domain-containing protein n=1 Tax=Paenibacillus sp. HB172176 TaxID=2493690 RepID=UPI0014399E8D|nr:AraC family transcriptional regulator [Paenibacillus sp. HB172176]
MNADRAIQIRRQSFNNSNKSNRPHVSHCFKAVWIRQGAAEWKIAGELHTVYRNNIVLLNNEEERQLERILSREDLEFFTLELEPPFLYDSGLLPLFMGPFQSQSASRIIPADENLLRMLERIEHEDRKRDGYSSIIIAACGMQLLAETARALGLVIEPRFAINPQMKAALAHIDEHFTRRISLKELAAIAYMSPTAFSKAFTKSNGIGPAQYMKRKRIGHAIRLLEETDRTVTDIAMDSGFTNMANFYKAFHSLTRQTPGDYRPVEDKKRLSPKLK